MVHPSSLMARLALLSAMVLAGGCSGPTDTSPPPAEATLAFTMDSSIFLVSSAEGSTPSAFLSGFTKPSWSPDGSTLAIVATSEPIYGGLPPTQALYLADADGGNVRALTDFDYLISGTALWSPDGTSLLIHRARTYMPSYSYVELLPAAGGPETPLPTDVRYTGMPSWSHDGSLLALDGSHIAVVKVIGGDTLSQLPGHSPQFSPVSDDLAFRDLASGHIHLIRPDSSADRDLQLDGDPHKWSPDGKRLAFAGTGGMYTTYPDGSHLTRIGPLNVYVSDLAWSADGQRIAYVTSGTSGPRTLYVARADDSDARPIVTGDVCCPSWKP